MQPAKNTNCISVRDLVFREKQKKLIDGVSFEVKPHQKIALVGLNGAGKSTLLNLLTGMLKPSQGEISIGGLNPGSPQLKRAIGVQYANTRAVPGLTAYEYLSLCCQTKPQTKVSVAELISKSTQQWRLEKILHRQMDELSQGNLQKLVVSQAFLHSPQYVFLDEPTQALDPVEQQRFIDNLELLKDVELCLFSSHHINETVAAADRVLMLHNGKLVADVDLADDNTRWLMSQHNQTELEALNNQFSSNHLNISVSFQGQSYSLFKVRATDLNELSKWQNGCLENQYQFRFQAKPQDALLPIFSALANGDL